MYKRENLMGYFVRIVQEEEPDWLVRENIYARVIILRVIWKKKNCKRKKPTGNQGKR